MVKMKKIISVLLAVSMLLTFMPAMAFADADEEMTPAEELIADAISSYPDIGDEYGDDDPDILGDEETIDDEDFFDEDLTDEESDPDADEESGDIDEVSDEEADDSEEVEGELSINERCDSDVSTEEDQEQQMEDFFLGGYETAGGTSNRTAAQSKKGGRLSGNNLKYYNYYKSLIKSVGAGKRTKAYIKVPITKIVGKRKFSAKELGLSSFTYKKNGKLYISGKAKKKIDKLILPENFNKLLDSLQMDLSSDGFWVNWWSDGGGGLSCNLDTNYTCTAKTLKFKSNTSMVLYVTVMPEFAKSSGASSRYKYIADAGAIKNALKARETVRSVIKSYNEEVESKFIKEGRSPEYMDYWRLWFYCYFIATCTSYDYTAAGEKTHYWMGPWSMVSVFDGDSSTKTVCEGYSRALKLLCDMSRFRSNWIDCQLASGDNHMWNTVRMSDGLNYMVDPTWMDDGDTVDTAWFLRGDPKGNANAFTVEYSHRVYDKRTKTIYAPAERILAKKSRYEQVSARKIAIKGTSIKKIKKGKKSFTVSWKAVKSSCGALYVDGYQIQYSTKKNFKGAKTVKVMGFAKKSCTVKKLKKKKVYYVRMRTFAKAGNKTYYSSWSKKKRIKTK